ncbi:TlpA disulfide reductase family protein [Thalassobellus suaedae]|uniref:TlpA disulfide reductase family protein n=1 Tax=Thalassobellus suaedae TaxID=3074124 RepID=A0ABY9XPI1_9FLAO|nr:TlpA disulfide reductase family protein [Flavobacteriaceae bacterium HL-DH14]WNH13127.1 TlpA disulfide reductase family protein [Flavobacteriaceae bacterium HL-DH10]
MKLKILFVAILIMVSCIDKKTNQDVAVKTNVESVIDNANVGNTDLEVYDFNGFKKFLNKSDDTIYVINFWATWCAPCVKELPSFEKLNAKYANKNVKVILVSLDFPHLYEKKLKPFIIDNKLKSKVIALDDADMNTWIPQVDASWSGSIPATIIYKNDTRKFFEQSFSFEELDTELKLFLDKNN